MSTENVEWEHYEGVAYPVNPTEYVCPECCPDRDFGREIIVVRYCHLHDKGVLGVADGEASVNNVTMCGTGEAGDVGSRALCDLIHRPNPRKGPICQPRGS